MMKMLTVTAAATMAGAAAIALAGGGVVRAKPEPKAEGGGTAVARGATLVQVGGCNHCHTPWTFDASLGMPVPDMKRMLSGHPADGPDPEGKVGKHDIGLIGPTFTSFAMPFGIVYAPNLTPAFFDLSSGEAGEILQKLRNYHIRLAVVYDPGSVVFSSRFGEMMVDEQGGPHFSVFASRQSAVEWLGQH